MAGVGKVSGASVLTLQVFLRKTYDEWLYERVLAALPESHAASLRSIVLPVNWYPSEAYVAALHTARDLSGFDQFWEQYGTFAADYQINLFARFVLHFTSPVFFLQRGARLWSRSHDTGRWDIEGGDKKMRGVLRDFAIVDACYCRILVAWIRRASRLTGARGGLTHPECRALGAEACVFEGWWK
jgi:hypothetical protein